MGIDYYVDQGELAELLKGRIDPERPLADQVQVKVSCMGDIAVMAFYPEDCDGVAWLALSQGPPGEPGRNINGEVDEGPRMLQTQPGVLIGATDPRSLDTIIDVLDALRRRLRGEQPVDLEAELCKAISKEVAKDIAEAEDQLWLEAAGAASARETAEVVDRELVASVEQEVVAYQDPTCSMGSKEVRLPARSDYLSLVSVSTHQIKGRGTVKTVIWPARLALPGRGEVVIIDGDLWSIRDVETDSAFRPGQSTVGLVVRRVEDDGGLDDDDEPPTTRMDPRKTPWGKVTQ